MSAAVLLESRRFVLPEPTRFVIPDHTKLIKFAYDELRTESICPSALVVMIELVIE